MKVFLKPPQEHCVTAATKAARSSLNSLHRRTPLWMLLLMRSPPGMPNHFLRFGNMPNVRPPAHGHCETNLPAFHHRGEPLAFSAITCVYRHPFAMGA